MARHPEAAIVDDVAGDHRRPAGRVGTMHWHVIEPLARSRIDDLHREASSSWLLRAARDGTDRAGERRNAFRALTGRLTRPVRRLTLRITG